MVMWIVWLISKDPNKCWPVLTALGRNTMGICIISNYANPLVLLKITTGFHLDYCYAFIELIVMLAFSLGIVWLIRKNKVFNRLYLGGRCYPSVFRRV